MTSDGLKPCPFCGNEDIKTRKKSELWNKQEIFNVLIFCSLCSGQVESLRYPKRGDSWEDAEREAVERWNKRADRTYPIHIRRNETTAPPFIGSL